MPLKVSTTQRETDRIAVFKKWLLKTGTTSGCVSPGRAEATYIISRERDEKQNRSHIFKQVDPFPSLRSLSANVIQSILQVRRAKCGFGDTGGPLPTVEHVEFSWSVARRIEKSVQVREEADLVFVSRRVKSIVSHDLLWHAVDDRLKVMISAEYNSATTVAHFSGITASEDLRTRDCMLASFHRCCSG